MTSEFRTKKGESSLARMSVARARGPAVPNGSDSTENVMRTLYSSSYYRNETECNDNFFYLLKRRHHYLWTIVHSEDDVYHTQSATQAHGYEGKPTCHAGGRKIFDLMD